MTSCPEEMVLRIWRFWKRVSWELTLDHVSRQLGSRQTVEVEDLRLLSYAERLGVVTIVWYERLLRTVSEVNKPFVPEQQSPTVYFVFPCICICICTVVIDIIMVVSIQQRERERGREKGKEGERERERSNRSFSGLITGLNGNLLIW